MTCIQLGGACSLEFKGDTFDEIANQSKKHGMEMYQKGDAAHIEAMQAMQQVMKTPNDFAVWFGSKKAEFDQLESV